MANRKVSPYYTGAVRAFYVTLGFWGLVVVSMFFGEVSWVHQFDYEGRLASIFILALVGMVIFGGFAFYFVKREERNQMGINPDT
jgi:ATP/ADP translocase